MFFVYFAFWGLQEEFSTLPCSPCFLQYFGCYYIILMRHEKKIKKNKNEQFNITYDQSSSFENGVPGSCLPIFTQFIFERKCGADLTLFSTVPKCLGAELSCFPCIRLYNVHVLDCILYFFIDSNFAHSTTTNP